MSVAVDINRVTHTNMKTSNIVDRIVGAASVAATAMVDWYVARYGHCPKCGAEDPMYFNCGVCERFSETE